ncbi:uncharacterized protein KY384_000478 [Bacidia gigantensis]|uniref:uncharacterized protein n=1 Tax=Bacidia gigantensis TaxID=2732470 RepID=UPI001D04673D|nr:uncharacterized protein KY384_000478 [Bacidia gigantensis]KAG8525718.1 hypothetical protein KY384_000478 [Bacidia gigantensis]
MLSLHQTLFLLLLPLLPSIPFALAHPHPHPAASPSTPTSPPTVALAASNVPAAYGIYLDTNVVSPPKNWALSCAAQADGLCALFDDPHTDPGNTANNNQIGIPREQWIFNGAGQTCQAGLFFPNVTAPAFVMPKNRMVPQGECDAYILRPLAQALAASPDTRASVNIPKDGFPEKKGSALGKAVDAGFPRFIIQATGDLGPYPPGPESDIESSGSTGGGSSG